MNYKIITLTLLVISCLLLCGSCQQYGIRVKSTSRKDVVVQGGEDPDPEIQARRNFVKNMMYDAWSDYVAKAWGENELKPVSGVGGPGNHFGGSKIGATIVDALDTLYIMELMDEFQMARDYVASELDFSIVNATISQFEANIRYIGGLLSAYSLSNDTIFFDKVVQLTDLLLPAFETPTGLPYRHINILTGEPNKTEEKNFLAEVATLHLEYTYLSDLTGNSIYQQKVDTIRNFLNDVGKPYGGLYPSQINVITGNWTSDYITIGPPSDSIFEYFLKAYVQKGSEDTLGLKMYHEGMNAFFQNGLVLTSEPSKLEYISEMVNGTIDPVVHHLACFVGGMLVSAIYWDPSHPNIQRDQELAINLTNTCYESYKRTVPQLGPARFRFTETEEAIGTEDLDKDWKLRPELIESLFILHRLTGDPKYREWGWEIAQNIEKYCKAGPGRGYSGIKDVYATVPEQDDVQQTYFLSEVLKYLYLLFSSDELLDIDNWVFNTEAHPLPTIRNPIYAMRH